MQLATVLEQERQVNLSADAPSTYPAKKGEGWKRTRHSQHGKQNPQYKQLKQAQLDAFKQVAQLGYIELMYLDESGCQLWTPVSYSYSPVREQKRLE